MSTVLEPFNLQRRIIGFDPFEGFSSLDARDVAHAETGKEHKPAGYAADSYEDLLQCIGHYDLNRPIGHVPKAEAPRKTYGDDFASSYRSDAHLSTVLKREDVDSLDELLKK
jgi:hypothetical protein